MLSGLRPPTLKPSDSSLSCRRPSTFIARSAGRDHPDLAANLHLLGQVTFGRAFENPDNQQVLVERAEAAMREALAMRRRIHGDKGFAVAETLNDLGLAIDAIGRAEEAMVMLEEALEIHREVLGEEHPDSLHMLNNVAAMYRDAGQYEQAEPLYRECLEQWKKIHPDDDRQMFAPIYGLGRVLLGLGDLDGAEEQLRRLLGIVEEETHDPRPYMVKGILGEVETRRGHFDAAEALLLDSHQALARLLVPGHPESVRTRARLVALYDSWGRPSVADAYRD